MDLRAILHHPPSPPHSPSHQTITTEPQPESEPPPPIRERESHYSRIKAVLEMRHPKKTKVGGQEPKRATKRTRSSKKDGQDLMSVFRQEKAVHRTDDHEEKLRWGEGPERRKSKDESAFRSSPVDEPREEEGQVRWTPINSAPSSQEKRHRSVSSDLSELTDVPDLPELPELPQPPKLPELPELSEVTEVPGPVTEVPEPVPEVPLQVIQYEVENSTGKPKSRRKFVKAAPKPVIKAAPQEPILDTDDTIHTAPKPARKAAKPRAAAPRRAPAAKITKAKPVPVETTKLDEPNETPEAAEAAMQEGKELAPFRIIIPKRKATTVHPSTPRTKKSKHQLGSSPFPGHPHPTPAETSQIATLLREHHGAAVRPPILQPSLTVTGCGEVPLVLDALIRTIISSNTSTANSAVALAGIVAAYGSKDGTINYDAIHERPVEDLEAAMRRAGLATIKSKNIKAILTEVAASPSHQPDTPLIQSLEHLRDLPTTEVMSALMSYKGVGVKIAACVCLFCLQRPVLAIDTHCYRMARFLGWIPEGASVDDTFWHLDAVVGDEWKYELHELFMKHGQTCEKCSREHAESARKKRDIKASKGKGRGKKAAPEEEKEDAKDEVKDEGENACVLEDYVTRVWVKKRAKKEKVEKMAKIEEADAMDMAEHAEDEDSDE